MTDPDKNLFYVSCELCGDEEAENHKRFRLLETLCLSVFCSMPLLWDLHPYVQFLLGTILILGPARYFYRGAWKSLKKKMPGMDLLVSLSASLIYAYSVYNTFTEKTEIKLYYLSEGVLVSLILFGRYLESSSRAEASQAIRKLLCLQPEKLTVIRSGQAVEISMEQLKPEDTVLVREGDRIPVDGKITEGSIQADESMLTGENRLAIRKVGDKVYCGTRNVSGSAKLEIIGSGSHTALQRIIDIVAGAQQNKSPTSRMADRAAAIFVPCILLAAIIVFFLQYYSMTPGNPGKALTCACSVLVIACPCALGLATPAAIMVGSGRAAELGLLFRDGKHLENAYRIDTIVFDKTGTLTYGPAEISEKSVEKIPTETPGKSIPEENLNDLRLRPGTKETIEKLKKSGYELWMISGDRQETAAAVAAACGIDNYLWGVLPEHKSGQIAELKASGHKVAMVGDGINDAPALASADLGIAMGCGNDIAIQSADIMLLGSGIENLPLVFEFSRKTMRVIYCNIAWAILYNLICIPLAAIGIVNPSIAAAAMSLSSNGVLFNSLRLKSMKAGQKSMKAGQKPMKAGQKSMKAGRKPMKAGQKSMKAGCQQNPPGVRKDLRRQSCR